MEDEARSAKARRVQVRRVRRDGWTIRRRELFLDMLAATCNVTRAVQAAGMSFEGVRQLRRRDAGFAASWDLALEEGYLQIEADLLARAIGGGDIIASDADRAGVAPPDPELGLRLLNQRRAGAQGRSGGRRVYKHVPFEEVEAILTQRLDALAKRLKEGQ